MTAPDYRTVPGGRSIVEAGSSRGSSSDLRLRHGSDGRNPTDLGRLLRPRSVAVVGASSRPTSPSGRPLKYLIDNGFPGRLYPVNPSHSAVMGLPSYPTVGALPEPVDVALIAVPAASVLSVLEDCRAVGIPFAVILSSGFAETGAAGAAIEKDIAELTSDGRLRVLGPNCEGTCNVADRVPLTFSPVFESELDSEVSGGQVGIVSQSGGLGFAVLDHGQRRGQSFSHVITTGNECDLDALEVCAALADDPGTAVVGLIFEGFRHPERLGDVASRFALSGKQLLALKLGTSASGHRAALRHTAHEAGDGSTYSALLDQYGVYECRSLDGLLDSAHAVARTRPVCGDRVGIVSSSGGAATLLADECERQGWRIPELTEVLQSRMSATMPVFGSALNPVDVTAQAVWNGGFSPTLETLGRSGEVDVVVLVTSLTAPGRLEAEFDALRSTIGDLPVPVLVYSYTDPHPQAVRLLGELGVAWFTSARAATNAIGVLAWTGRHTAGVLRD